MGIKNLLKFLTEYNELIDIKNVKDYYGKRIAIDISILIYQMVIAIRNSGSDLTNEKGEITSHILGLFNKTLSFLEKGIIPIYVFDGKPPILKQKILDNRKQIRKKALDKLNEAITEEEKIKYLKRSVCITKEQMDQCRELLNLMGIPYIDAPEEADSQLAYLCKSNMVYAVLTEDMDILTFGSPKIIRNLSSTKKEPIELNLNNILKRLNLTYDEFIELCILFGCDYCPIISDIKTQQLYQIYNKHKSIEETLIDIKSLGINIPDKYEYKEAKEYFKKSIHKKVSNNELILKHPNNQKLIDTLVNKYGLIKYKVIGKVNKLIEYYNKFKNVNEI
jgi:flap endonuclease-1